MPEGDDGHALDEVARHGDHHGKRAGHRGEEVGRRRQFTGESELARGFAVQRVIRPQHRRRP